LEGFISSLSSSFRENPNHSIYTPNEKKIKNISEFQKEPWPPVAKSPFGRGVAHQTEEGCWMAWTITSFVDD